VVDAVAACGLAVLLAPTAGWFFAERAVVTFRVYSPHTVWNGPIPLVLGAISPLSYGLAFAVCAVLVGEALWGMGPGKVLTGQMIIPAEKNIVSRRLWRRYALKLAPWWLFCLSLVTGWWPLACLAGLAGALALVAGLTALVAGRTLWYDRFSRTRVGRRP